MVKNQIRPFVSCDMDERDQAVATSTDNWMFNKRGWLKVALRQNSKAYHNELQDHFSLVRCQLETMDNILSVG